MTKNVEFLRGQVYILQTVVEPYLTKEIKQLREHQREILNIERRLRGELIRAEREADKG